MGISERKEREKGEMKRKITAAAMKMFLEDGYAKTSIRNIADAVEYSPGTIYLYYKDKDELLYEVQREAYLKLLEEFRLHANSKDPVKKLEQLGKVYVSFGLENPELYDLIFIIRAPMNADHALLENNGGKAFEYLVNCLQDCIKDNLLIFEDPLRAAMQVWAMVHGIVSLNIRCRLKFMGLKDEEMVPFLHSSVEEYIQSIIR